MKPSQEVVRYLNCPGVKDKFLSNGTDVYGTTPEELAAVIKSEMTTLGKAIKDAHIQAE